MESFLESHKTRIRPENLTNRERSSFRCNQSLGYIKTKIDKEERRRKRRESSLALKNSKPSNLQERYINYIRNRSISTYTSPYKLSVEEEEEEEEEKKSCEIEIWRRIRKRQSKQETKRNYLRSVAKGLIHCESARESLKEEDGLSSSKGKRPHHAGSEYDNNMLFHLAKSMAKSS